MKKKNRTGLYVLLVLAFYSSFALSIHFDLGRDTSVITNGEYYTNFSDYDDPLRPW